MGDEMQEKNLRFFSCISSPIMENKLYLYSEEFVMVHIHKHQGNESAPAPTPGMNRAS